MKIIEVIRGEVINENMKVKESSIEVHAIMHNMVQSKECMMTNNFDFLW